VSRDRERYPSKGTRSCPLSPASDPVIATGPHCGGEGWGEGAADPDSPSSALRAPSPPQSRLPRESLSLVGEKGKGTTFYVGFLLTAAASPVLAQAQPPAGKIPPRPLDPAQKALLSESFFLIAVVILFGLGLVLLTMLWGWRTRRFLRKKIPAATPPDDLWFLKGKHPPEPPAAP
jgi:hypothetical protein